MTARASNTETLTGPHLRYCANTCVGPIASRHATNPRFDGL